MKTLTVVLIAILVGAGFAAWFFTNYEKVTTTQQVGYRGEARINEFLAADLLLVELGLSADSRATLTPYEWLPDVDDTLITRASASFSVGENKDILINWVREGGHLVLLPPFEPSRIVDDFLAELGLALKEFQPETEEESEAQGSDNEASEDADYLIDLDNTQYRIVILEPELAGTTLNDQVGVVVARRAFGGGFVTLAAGAHYFTNLYIGDSDHGRLLLDIVAGYVEPGMVWFIYDAEFPSLWEIVWSRAPMMVICLAAALFLWLLSLVPRFGPVTTPEPPRRRSIIEHVRAAGNFVWRNHGSKALVASSRNSIMQKLEVRRPGFARLSMEEKALQIARVTGFSPQSIIETLSLNEDLNQRDFMHNMQALQRIRSRL